MRGISTPPHSSVPLPSTVTTLRRTGPQKEGRRLAAAGRHSNPHRNPTRDRPGTPPSSLAHIPQSPPTHTTPHPSAVGR